MQKKRNSRPASCLFEQWSKFSVPPSLVVAFWLAKNTPFTGWLNFHKIAMHRTHAIIEPFGQVIELHKLLRQVAPRITEMHHAAIGGAFF